MKRRGSGTDTLWSAVQKLNDAARALVWGPATLALLLGTGLWLSVRCGFPQGRHFGRILRETAGSLFRRGEKAERGGLSPFQALCTALGGTVGTGNIAGVTGAILVGGPGAVFWMWAAAFFGMCTKYAEIALALRYRAADGKGGWRGGPMYYIEKGLGPGWRWLALLFALFGGLASFGIGNLAQSCEIAAAAKRLFGADARLTGLLLAALVSAVLLGGVRRVGRLTGLLVPLMAGGYVLAALAGILPHLSELPDVFRAIFRGAFSLRAAGGGLCGAGMLRAMRWGFARGVFSNEAGLGSSPMAHASAFCREPCAQAAWGVLEVFLDSFVICTLTALAVLLSGAAELPGAAASFSSGGDAAAEAFSRLLPGVGGLILPAGMLFFALSSLISWAWYGEVCWSYLFRGRKAPALLFRITFSAACVLGALGAGGLLWEISDTLNGLMALPNLTALLLLSGRVAAMSKAWFAKK